MSDERYYNTRLSFDKEREKVWKEVVKYLQIFVSNESSVLDLGAGYCTFINNIKAKEKYALDLYNGFVRYANTDVKTFVGSCVSLKRFKDNSLDIVFASNLIEHLTNEEAEKTIKEVFRILKSGGVFIIVQPNFRYCYKDYFDDYTHKTIYTDIGMEDFLKNNKFKIIRKERKFLPFSLKSSLPKSRFLVRIYLSLPFRPFAKQMLIIAKKEG